MARRRTRGAPEPGTAVPTWPRITARLESDGRGKLSWNAVDHEIDARDRDSASAAIVVYCTRLAQTITRPVRLELHESEWIRQLAVFPTGGVQPLGDDGVPEHWPDDGPAPAVVTGTCRTCSLPASAAESFCPNCGAVEPLSRSAAEPLRVGRVRRVDGMRRTDATRRADGKRPRAEAEPGLESDVDRPRSGRRALRRGAESAQAPPPISAAPQQPRRAARQPSAPRALVIEFDDQTRAVLTGSAALGRNPSPVDGRIPVRVDSGDNTVSRTHALVDLDQAGRILVTDYHSTYGVHLSGRRISTFSPGVAYRVPSGAQLRLGDVACRVSTTRSAI